VDPQPIAVSRVQESYRDTGRIGDPAHLQTINPTMTIIRRLVSGTRPPVLSPIEANGVDLHR
jgi:hypothetical protein